MSKFDRDILIRNISALLENKKVTQRELGEILGMSQPNISKDLSPNDKKCFTLEQVVNIADYFGVSVDSLVGNEASGRKHSPREIGKFLSDLLLSGDAKMQEIEVEEWVSEVDYQQSVQEKRKNKYPAVYLEGYYQPQTDEESMEASQVGNDTVMLSVNDFLRKYLQILNVYRQDGLDEDLFEQVVSGLLDNLRN